MKKRIGAMLTALALVGAMLPSAMAVDLDKSATPLTDEDKTTVTLRVGASQETVTSNVVFVLDKSTSADVRGAAKSMLEELNGQVSEGNTVNVAVVYFESTASTTDWYKLDNSTLETIKTAIDYKQNESGTNAWLGLKTGKELLDACPGQNNHLVLVTDGIVWLWGGPEASGLKTIFNEFITNNTDYAPDNNAWNIWAGPNVVYPDYVKYSDDLALTAENGNYVESLNNAKTWLEANGAEIESLISSYERSYEGSSILYNSEPEQADSTTDTYGAYVGRVENGNCFTACDAAIYKTMTMWQEIIDKGYSAYAFADTTGSNAGNVTAYPWASKFVGGLSSLGGTSMVVSNENISGMFNGVKDSILYEIQSGTVTDPIGEYYIFDSLDTVTLTVDGSTVERDDPAAEGYAVSFNSGNYGVNYDETDRVLTWDINTPVEQGKAVALSYGLTVDQSKVPTNGTVVAPTNGETTLTYESTTGDVETAEFEVPEFTLGEKESIPTPDKKADGEDEIGNVATGDIIPFTITTTLPETIVGTEAEEHTMLIFRDTMNGLELVGGTIKLTINGVTIPEEYYDFEDASIADPEYLESGNTFAVAVDLSAINASNEYGPLTNLGAGSVVLSYSGEVTAEMGDSVNNEAWINDNPNSDKTPGKVTIVTGGSGTLMFTLGGAALLAAAGALFVVNRRKSGN